MMSQNWSFQDFSHCVSSLHHLDRLSGQMYKKQAILHYWSEKVPGLSWIYISSSLFLLSFNNGFTAMSLQNFNFWLGLGRDCNPGIPAVFANPESRDWRCPNSGISGLQKMVKIALFWGLNAKNNNSRGLLNKIFYACQSTTPFCEKGMEGKGKGEGIGKEKGEGEMEWKEKRRWREM